MLSLGELNEMTLHTVGLHRDGGRQMAPNNGRNGAKRHTIHHNIKSHGMSSWKKLLVTTDIIYKVSK